MRWLLSITLLFLLATDVFHWDLTYTAGLSAKNAVLYILIVFLLLRLVVTRTGTLEARPLYAAWGLLIAYAMFTWIIAGVIVGYERYDLIESGIRLKSGLIDHFIFFLVFFLGTRTEGDAIAIARALLFGSIFANLAQIADVTGVIGVGQYPAITGPDLAEAFAARLGRDVVFEPISPDEMRTSLAPLIGEGPAAGIAEAYLAMSAMPGRSIAPENSAQKLLDVTPRTTTHWLENMGL